MMLHELQAQALKLSVEERWQLMQALMLSLQPRPRLTAKPKGSAMRLVGLARTDAPPPTDEEVKVMLDERLAEKYL